MYKLIGLPACHPGTQYQRSCCCPLCQLGFLCPQMPSAPNNHPITPVLQKLKRYDNNPIDLISQKNEKKPSALNNHVMLQSWKNPLSSIFNITKQARFFCWFPNRTEERLKRTKNSVLFASRSLLYGIYLNYLKS